MPEDQTLPLTDDPPADDFDRVFGAGGGTDTASDEFLDFDPSEAVVFADIEPGTYTAEVAEPPKKQVSQNGNPMMVVVFMVTDDQLLGARVWRRYMLSGKGGGWTKEFLNAIDLTEEAEGRKKIDPAKIVGRRCTIVVKPQKDNDQYMEVTKVKRHPAGPLAEAEPF